MREASYTTIKGAKRYFLSLADDFEFSQEDKERLSKCETVKEIEHVWNELIRKL